MIEERKPDASSQPSFAERISDVEREILDAGEDDWATCEPDDLRALLACIREQQAALSFYADSIGYTPIEAEPGRIGFKNGEVHDRDRGEKARAVLARWRLK